MSKPMGKIKHTEFVHLQNAHVNQSTSGHVKSPWSVQMNITNEELAQFPAYIQDKDMFLIMNFAKKFELIAFNEGIGFGKKKQADTFKPFIEELKNNLKLAKEENERLAETLDRLTRKEV